jgi:hypothetical protein
LDPGFVVVFSRVPEAYSSLDARATLSLQNAAALLIDLETVQ